MFNYASGGQKWPCRRCHVLFVEVLHPVNFVNISKKEGKDLELIQSSTTPIPCLVLMKLLIYQNSSLRVVMLTYTFIKSHSHVIYPGPKGSHVFLMLLPLIFVKV